jgi:hypothetical protein
MAKSSVIDEIERDLDVDNPLDNLFAFLVGSDQRCRGKNHPETPA